MGRRTFLAGAIVGLLLLVASGATAATTFTDPQGDAQGGAADLTQVAVSNDVDGNITFELTLANRATLAADDLLVLFLDTDENPATGTHGIEYAIGIAATEADLSRSSGSGFAPAPAPTLSVANGGRTIRINRDDLGEARSFTFFAYATRQANSAVGDDAPDDGRFYLYRLTLKPVLDSLSAHFSPARPRAGKSFRLASASLRLEDGTNVRADRIGCVAKLNGRRLAGRCSWRIPATARGQRLVVTLTARYRGTVATFVPWRFRVG